MRKAFLLLAAALLAGPASARSSVKKLLKAFEEGQAQDRIRLAPALGRAKDHRATELLLERFDPRKGDPRESAAYVSGLGLSGDERAAAPLVAALDYMRTTAMQLGEELPGHLQVLRWRILEALARVGGEQAVAALSTAVNDADPRVVEEAARGLGALKVKDAVPALSQLAAKGGNLGQAAIEALADIGDKRAVSALEQLQKGTDRLTDVQVQYALAKLGQKDQVKALEKGLEGDPGDGKAAILAAYYLAKLDKNSGIAYLDKLLKRKDEPLAPLAAEALGKTGNERAALPLIEALESSDQTVRLMCARGLTRLGGARALSALKKLRNDPNPAIRSSALTGLADWGELD